MLVERRNANTYVYQLRNDVEHLQDVFIGVELSPLTLHCIHIMALLKQVPTKMTGQDIFPCRSEFNGRQYYTWISLIQGFPNHEKL